MPSFWFSLKQISIGISRKNSALCMTHIPHTFSTWKRMYDEYVKHPGDAAIDSCIRNMSQQDAAETMRNRNSWVRDMTKVYYCMTSRTQAFESCWWGGPLWIRHTRSSFTSPSGEIGLLHTHVALHSKENNTFIIRGITKELQRITKISMQETKYGIK